jgi:hypothetical protein
MFSNLSSVARASVIALTALASVPAMAPAAPLGPTVMPAVADNSSNKPILVWQGEGRNGNYRRIWPRVGGGGGHWNGGGGGHWNGGGHWGHGGNWNHGGWDNGWGWGSGLGLGLGLGIPLGYYGGYYGGGYYDPYYGGGYYDDPVPVYRPRVYRPRVYRDRSYNNGRTYYNQGPRPQCDNEYQTGPKFSGCR